jgi:hypothetical protein
MNAPVAKTQTLRLDQIVRDVSLSCRVEGTREATAADYAEAMTAGAKFPPVTVYFDGTRYLLADGFHRCRARELIGETEIECAVHKGSEKEALLFGAGSNALHGLARTTRDKIHVVTRLLSFDEWRAKSDRWIADTCGVGHPFVAKLRAQVVSDSTTVREGRDGKIQSATKPKKKIKKGKVFDAVRASKAVRKDLDKIAKDWSGETIESLIETVQNWIAERSAHAIKIS